MLLFIENKDVAEANRAYYATFVETTCTITERSNIKNHHRTYDYVFRTIEGEQYTGQQALRVKKSGGKGAYLYNILHAGDTVSVWYDPADPSVSYMTKLNITGSYRVPSIFGFLLACGSFLVTLKWAFSD